MNAVTDLVRRVDELGRQTKKGLTGFRLYAPGSLLRFDKWWKMRSLSQFNELENSPDRVRHSHS